MILLYTTIFFISKVNFSKKDIFLKLQLHVIDWLLYVHVEAGWESYECQLLEKLDKNSRQVSVHLYIDSKPLWCVWLCMEKSVNHFLLIF